MAGYSFLKKWIYKPGIEEVNLNAYNDIEVIEAGGRSIKIPDKFSSPQHAIDVVRRMLNAWRHGHRRYDAQRGWISG